MTWMTIALIGLGLVALVVVAYIVFAALAFRSVRKMQDNFFDQDDDFFGRR